MIETTATSDRETDDEAKSETVNHSNQSRMNHSHPPGPCGGKSTAMATISDRLLSLGYRVFRVPEAATLVITGTSINFGAMTLEVRTQRGILTPKLLSSSLHYSLTVLSHTHAPRSVVCLLLHRFRSPTSPFPLRSSPPQERRVFEASIVRTKIAIEDIFTAIGRSGTTPTVIICDR